MAAALARPMIRYRSNQDAATPRPKGACTPPVNTLPNAGPPTGLKILQLLMSPVPCTVPRPFEEGVGVRCVSGVITSLPLVVLKPNCIVDTDVAALITVGPLASTHGTELTALADVTIDDGLAIDGTDLTDTANSVAAITALAAREGADWIWKGASTLAPAHDRAMLSLSRGGGDAA